MKTITLGALTLAALATPVAAQPAEKPKLIVAISVDQFSADLFAEYRGMFTGGLKRLMQGAVFPSGYQGHAATETCPGHSTILTGSRPARTGIIANTWFDVTSTRPDKKIYCSEDESVPGTSFQNYSVSPLHLKVPTLGDRMKAANPATRVVSVAGKDRSAVMMGGHNTDQIWYWANKAYVTLPGRSGAIPAEVQAINARTTALIAKAETSTVPAQCRTHARAVPVGKTSVGTTASREAGDHRSFRASPDFDTATADLAMGFLRSMKLGKGSAPDVLIVGLSATDYVGHGLGNGGAEMCAQMVALDTTIGRILSALDANGAPYAVVLTADHGGHDLPERIARQGMPEAVRVEKALYPADMSKVLEDEFKLEAPLLYGDGPFGDWYLSAAVPTELRPRVLAAATAKLRAHSQVYDVFTKEDLRRAPKPVGSVDEWSIAERVRASFDPERSGDLIVILKPRVTPINEPGMGYVATHGSPWIYDRRVPILFYRPNAVGFEQPLAIETADILPTLAGLVGLAVPPEEIDGRCVDLDPSEASTCTR